MSQYSGIDGGGPNNWDQPWLCTKMLKTLAELNEQCLELLMEQALLRASPAEMPQFLIRRTRR